MKFYNHDILQVPAIQSILPVRLVYMLWSMHINRSGMDTVVLLLWEAATSAFIRLSLSSFHVLECSVHKACVDPLIGMVSTTHVVIICYKL
jgi:hypothetical protein